MISYAGYRTGFPFPIFHKSPNGLPFEEWDGVTVDGVDLTYRAAAASGAEVYGPGTFHPIGFPIDEFAELVWRVKRITNTSDWTLGAYDTGSSFIEFDVDFIASIERALFPSGLSVETESNLVRRHNFFELSDPEETFDGWTLISFWPSDDWSQGNVMKVGDLYYPCILVHSAGCFTALRGNETGGFLDYPVSYISANVFGRDLPLWASSVFPVGTPPLNPPFSGSGTITVEAAEYWPYNGKWNSITGVPE